MTITVPSSLILVACVIKKNVVGLQVDPQQII